MLAAANGHAGNAAHLIDKGAALDVKLEVRVVLMRVSLLGLLTLARGLGRAYGVDVGRILWIRGGCHASVEERRQG
jgi:hypothetical protein